MNRTALVVDPLYIKHDPGPWHPESPDRLLAIYSQIETSGLIDQLATLPPRPATREEICRVHTAAHFERVEATDGRTVSLDPDTATSPDSFRAALLAAGGLLVLTEAVVAGRHRNGFALVRPPGHHAERDRAMGFCLFNNVAIAAQHARSVLGMERVLVVDWDLHHGNGTMHTFYDRSDVLYFSCHQYPFYPGTGAVEDVGVGAGEGFTVNVPLTPRMGDVEYRAVFREIVVPITRQYAPDLILVSAGFDPYYRDPLGGMRVSAGGFAALTSCLQTLADESAQGRLVLTLEGGYHIEGQAECASACIQTLLGSYPVSPEPDDVGLAEHALADAKAVLRHYWRLS